MNTMSKTFREQNYQYSSWEDDEWRLKRDKKRYFKPNKKFKHYKKRHRKAQEKQAFIKDPDLIPEFPKEDTHDWL